MPRLFCVAEGREPEDDDAATERIIDPGVRAHQSVLMVTVSLDAASVLPMAAALIYSSLVVLAMRRR